VWPERQGASHETCVDAFNARPVAVGHLLRLVLGVEIRVAGVLVPLWVSVIPCVVPAGLVIALWRENRDG
jgi:hypothetical protein